MTDKPSLLPNNATPFERAMEQGTARVGDVAIPIGELWNPQTCPMDLLPWLAWALSVDRWDFRWNEDQKRAAVAGAIAEQRHKGTRKSVEDVLASYDNLLTLTEWFESQKDPYTFAIDLPLISTNGDLGGARSSAAFAESIIRDVIRTKPARAHFTLTQSLKAASTVGIIAAGHSAFFVRDEFTADEAAAGLDWGALLTTETGEPLEIDGVAGPPPGTPPSPTQTNFLQFDGAA